MKIMGLDASTTSTGWSVFDDGKLIDYGVIKPTGEDWRDRLFNQGKDISGILDKYQPEIIYMEDVPLKAANVKALVILGAVQGFFYGIASSKNIHIEFLQPNEWRSLVGLYDGTRKGTERNELKKKSIEKANGLFGLNLVYKSPSSKFNQDDEADALLIAFSQIKTHSFKKPKST